MLNKISYTIKKLIVALKTKAFWIAVIKNLIFALVVFIGISYYKMSTMVQGIAPKINTYSIDNTNIKNPIGKPYLVHFWSSSCSICGVEAKSIEELSKENIVINIAVGDNTNEINSFAIKHQIDVKKTILDSNSGISKKYGVAAFPSSFIVDTKGNIKFSSYGYTPKWLLSFYLWVAS
jgi:thiol-disulfide isomerase/thioredoxin